MKEKILGTVQLGMPYGINNGVMPERSDSISILESAFDMGLKFLDTARGYGEALEVIGEYHQKNPTKKFQIFSKFMLEDLELDFSTLINEQCEILSIDKMTGLYFHRFHEYEQRPDIIQEAKLPKSKVELIGVSVYSLQETKKVMNDPAIDIVQVPLSIFHHHSALNSYLNSFSSENLMNKKVYARSIYLQGILFLPYEKLTGKLTSFIPVREFIDNLASKHSVTKEMLAASYIMDRKIVAGVLFGAETSEQVKGTYKILKPLGLDWDTLLKEMPRIDEDLLNPGNWK